MFVVCASIDVATGKAFCAEAVVGKHAFNSKFHSESGVFSHKGFVVDLFEMAYITGVMIVFFLDEFVTSENCFSAFTITTKSPQSA